MRDPRSPHRRHPQVVVGYEPGDEHAVLEALAQARLRGGTLTVVAAAPLPDGLLLRCRTALAGLDVRLPPEGADLTEALLEHAEREHAALLVVGLPRRGVDDLLGGRARLVVLDAPCPVLAVPEPGGTCCPTPAEAVTMGA
ncbi:universal stress protein [Kineococcus sp. SYSU DK002]|uniref:universal stress protein n=1 Tax=Kineococcus sp. SYSU DK002 TaxID=3383123 RepID=UPI003D7D262B